MAQVEASTRVFEVLTFRNYLHSIALTSTEIETQVAKIYYHPDPFRDDEAEGELPYQFVTAFYSYIERFNRLPFQQKFWDSYCYDLEHRAHFDLNAQSESYKHGLEARIKSRVYPALIRDIHFAKLLSEQLPDNYTLTYNPELDFKYGIDVLIYDNNKKHFWGLCLLQDTETAKEQLRRKKKKRKAIFKLDYAEVYINVNTHAVGIQLYAPSEVEKVIRVLEAINQ